MTEFVMKLLVIFLSITIPVGIHGFVSKTRTLQIPQNNVVMGGSSSSSSSTVLFGAFHKRNKQADLMKKMQQAKEEREEKQPEEKKELSDEEIKERNDRKRFEELLNREGVTANNYDYGVGDNYLTKEQEEEDMTASQRGVDRLFEGDPAPTAPFEDLTHMTTENALSKKGTKRLLPWLSGNTKDYLIIISDPRAKSLYMRKVYKQLTASLSEQLKQRLIFINADTPAENRKCVFYPIHSYYDCTLTFSTFTHSFFVAIYISTFHWDMEYIDG